MYCSLVPVVAYVRAPFLLKAEYYFIVCIYCCVVLVTQSCPTPCDPMDCKHQAPLSMQFSRQEYWSGLPFPSSCIYYVLFICLSLWQCRKLLFKISVLEIYPSLSFFCQKELGKTVSKNYLLLSSASLSLCSSGWVTDIFYKVRAEMGLESWLSPASGIK